MKTFTLNRITIATAPLFEIKGLQVVNHTKHKMVYIKIELKIRFKYSNNKRNINFKNVIFY